MEGSNYNQRNEVEGKTDCTKWKEIVEKVSLYVRAREVSIPNHHWNIFLMFNRAHPGNYLSLVRFPFGRRNRRRASDISNNKSNYASSGVEREKSTKTSPKNGELSNRIPLRRSYCTGIGECEIDRANILFASRCNCNAKYSALWITRCIITYTYNARERSSLVFHPRDFSSGYNFGSETAPRII